MNVKYTQSSQLLPPHTVFYIQKEWPIPTWQTEDLEQHRIVQWFTICQSSIPTFCWVWCLLTYTCFRTRMTFVNIAGDEEKHQEDEPQMFTWHISMSLLMGFPFICAAFSITSRASSTLLFAISQRADFGKTLEARGHIVKMTTFEKEHDPGFWRMDMCSFHPARVGTFC